MAPASDWQPNAVSRVPPPPSPPPPSSREFVCGWGAAFVNICITYPINKIMFRQILHGVSVSRAFSQLRHEGVGFLYRGVLPPLFQKTVSVSLMFGMYDQYRRMLSSAAPQVPVSVCNGGAAVMAGMTEAMLTPFERLQTLMQDRHYHNHYTNTWHAARELRRLGLTEYYRGLVPILVRNGVSNLLFFELRGRMKAAAPARMSRTRELMYDFCCGAVLGACISTLVYPLNVVKTHLQARVGGPYRGVLHTLAEVYRTRGHSVRHIFRGVHVNNTRSLLSWGIINCTYELLKSHLA